MKKYSNQLLSFYIIVFGPLLSLIAIIQLAQAADFKFEFDAAKNPPPEIPQGATVGAIVDVFFEQKVAFGSTGFPNGANFENQSSKTIQGFWISLKEENIKAGDAISQMSNLIMVRGHYLKDLTFL